MLKEICSIELCGANFENLTRLDIFNSMDREKHKTIKGTLLYGRNGAGKSTIARGFRKIIGESGLPIRQAWFLDKNGAPIILTESEKRNIFVFDEDYVNKNVRLQEDHLDTIVMLGEQVDLTKRIEDEKNAFETAKIEFDKWKTIYVEYQERSNKK